MNSIKKMFVLCRQNIHLLARRPAAQRLNALENSVLAKLPVELLQQIINDLPISSAASFSISCRKVYFLIGTKYLTSLASSSDETLVFLNLIERDLQDHIVCSSCRQLHRIGDARKYTEDGRQRWPVVITPKCLSDDRDTMVTSFIYRNFSTTVFKMVMKHHRIFGNDTWTRQLLRLLSWQVHPTYNWGNLLFSLNAECRVHDGSLFTHQRLASSGKCEGVGAWRDYFWICPHLELISTGQPVNLRITGRFPHPLNEMWSGSLHNKDSSDIENSSWVYSLNSGLKQCQFCRTECEVEVRHDHGCKFKISISIWKDIGQWPEGEGWQNKVCSPEFIPQPIQFHQGDIASIFDKRASKLSWNQRATLLVQGIKDSIMLEMGLI